MFRAAGFETYADQLQRSSNMMEFHLELKRIEKDLEIAAHETAKLQEIANIKQEVVNLQQQFGEVLEKASPSPEGGLPSKPWYQVECNQGCGERVQAFIKEQHALEKQRSDLAHLAVKKLYGNQPSAH